jgi:DNA polymerase
VLSNVGFRRDEVYICNVLKCRPPENRDPLPQEIALCEPYLWHQLELINPELIVALGRISAQSLLNSTTPIGKLREATFLYRGIPFIVTYHPAAILRNPSYRKILDEDIKKVRRFYDELKRKSYPDQSG